MSSASNDINTLVLLTKKLNVDDENKQEDEDNQLIKTLMSANDTNELFSLLNAYCCDQINGDINLELIANLLACDDIQDRDDIYFLIAKWYIKKHQADQTQWTSNKNGLCDDLVKLSPNEFYKLLNKDYHDPLTRKIYRVVPYKGKNNANNGFVADQKRIKPTKRRRPDSVTREDVDLKRRVKHSLR